MKIRFICSSLENGGAERSLTLMANYWADQGEEVAITMLYRFAPTSPYYTLHPQISLTHLPFFERETGVVSSTLHNIKGLAMLRRHLMADRPTVVICFLNWVSVCTLLSTIGLGIPTIISERNNPRGQRAFLLLRILRHITYHWCNRLVILSDELKDFHSREVQKKISVIPNMVIPTSPSLVARPDAILPNRRTLVAMGRLHYQKGFDLLLQAFNSIASKHPDWDLYIVGEGAQRSELESMVSNFGLSHRVYLPGFVDDVTPWLQHADLFVLSSRYEGFPRALAEAMSAGLPVVSYACPSGPRDMIEHYKNGLLVEPLEAESLGTALDE
ncbi:MAG: glycosyltransferase family 4 protein, partial [Bdellovibrionales bacterium]|nr:glycosyltransferase family 4 protein [Bdellovibrionales bacterium]